MNSTNDREIVKFEGKDEIEGLGYWITAKDLMIGDKCLLSDGNYGIIVNVNTEECEKFTTYNFEVVDYHTYYVGVEGILVHNKCSGSYEIEFSDGKKYIGKGSKNRMLSSEKRIAKKYGVKVVVNQNGNTLLLRNKDLLMNIIRWLKQDLIRKLMDLRVITHYFVIKYGVLGNFYKYER